MMPVRCEGGVNYLMRQNGAVRANAKTGTNRASASLRTGAWSREGKDEGEGLTTLTPFVLAIAVAVRSSEQWKQMQFFLLLNHFLQSFESRSSRRMFCKIHVEHMTAERDGWVTRKKKKERIRKGPQGCIVRSGGTSE